MELQLGGLGLIGSAVHFAGFCRLLLWALGASSGSLCWFVIICEIVEFVWVLLRVDVVG